MANTLDESLYLQRKTESPVIEVITTVLQDIVGDDLRLITLEGVKIITPLVLATEIAPYLQAIQDVQEVYIALHPEKQSELSENASRVRIVSLHNEAPKIEIVNAAETIRAANDVFTPRKRKQDAEQRDLQNENLRLQNERVKNENEAHLKQLQIETDPQIVLEEKNAKIALLREEVKAKQLENRENELELEERIWKIEQARMREYFAIAMELLERFKSDEMTIDDLAVHLPKLTAAVKTIWESNLTLRIGWHDKPRPDTLPK